MKDKLDDINEKQRQRQKERQQEQKTKTKQKRTDKRKQEGNSELRGISRMTRTGVKILHNTWKGTRKSGIRQER
jgi:hypothetical protein